eukprot:GHVH01011148.1.p1 GENE.GHVH01011148.1~~GHVH01011148.1.p1  ORF type:complete len:189 (+),score=24.92 GHVH01011148.1:118-684(+)
MFEGVMLAVKLAAKGIGFVHSVNPKHQKFDPDHTHAIINEFIHSSNTHASYLNTDIGIYVDTQASREDLNALRSGLASDTDGFRNVHLILRQESLANGSRKSQIERKKKLQRVGVEGIIFGSSKIGEAASSSPLGEDLSSVGDHTAVFTDDLVDQKQKINEEQPADQLKTPNLRSARPFTQDGERTAA